MVIPALPRRGATACACGDSEAPFGEE